MATSFQSFLLTASRKLLAAWLASVDSGGVSSSALMGGVGKLVVSLCGAVVLQPARKITVISPNSDGAIFIISFVLAAAEPR